MSHNSKGLGSAVVFEGLILIILGCLTFAIAGGGPGPGWANFGDILGLILITGGLTQFILSVHVYRNASMSSAILNSLTLIVIGLFALFFELGPDGWSVLFLIYFLLRGIFELITCALSREHGGWSWLFFSSLFCFFFALLLWLNWTVSPNLLVAYVGFNLLFSGITRLGWGVKSSCCKKEE